MQHGGIADTLILTAMQHIMFPAALVKGWEIMDIGPMSVAAKQQGLNMWVDKFHFLPLVYQNFNDVMLNLLCAVGPPVAGAGNLFAHGMRTGSHVAGRLDGAAMFG